MLENGFYKYHKEHGRFCCDGTDNRYWMLEDFFLPYDELMETTHPQDFWEDPEILDFDYNSELTPDVKRLPLLIEPGIDVIKFTFAIEKIDWRIFSRVVESKRDIKISTFDCRINAQDTKNHDNRLEIDGNEDYNYHSIIISSDKFKLTIKKTNFEEKKRRDSRIIEIHVDSYWDGAKNIPNQTYSDVNVTLKNILDDLITRTGIYIYYESLIVTYVEVNMTFAPMGDASELVRLIAPFQTFLPKVFKLNEDYKRKHDLRSEYVEKKPLKMMKYNGMRAKSTTIEIKIYDKKFDHNSKKDSRKIKTDLIRIEFTVCKPKQIASHFKNCKWAEMSNQNFRDGFFAMLDYYVYRNYKKYIERGRKELVNYFKTIDITDRQWRKKLREYSDGFYRKSAGGFLTYSKEDIRLFVDQIKAPSVKSNKSRICKSVEEILVPKTENKTRDNWVYNIQCLLEFCRRMQKTDTVQETLLYMVEFDD